MSFRRTMSSLRRSSAARVGLLACGLTACLAAAPGAASAAPGAWSFETAPSLHPMQVQVFTSKQGVGKGDIFLAPFKNFGVPNPFTGQAGPLILDNQGNPVWFKAVPKGQQTLDFSVQTYQGKPVLVYWEGPLILPPASPAGVPVAGQGAFFIYDQHYKLIKKVTGQSGWTADPHDFVITKQGTAVFPVVQDKSADLSSIPNGSATGQYEDNGIQEVNIKTGREVGATWDEHDHVALSNSEIGIPPAAPQGFVWDPYHVNSVDLDSSGHMLVSDRSTWGIYNVDRASGNIIWTLGGKSSTFTAGINADFSYQHDARYLPGNEVSVFDDSCCNLPNFNPARHARGLVLKLDLTAKTSTVVRAYTHSPGLFVPTQGSMQTLANGNVFVGWGQQPVYSEYTQSGKLLLDVQMPVGNESYRTLRFPWTGKPTTKPSVVVQRAGAKGTAYVSWNGATDVSSWALLGGSTKKQLKLVTSVSRNGFETAIHFTSRAKRFEVLATNAKGKLLGSSRVVSPSKAKSAKTTRARAAAAAVKIGTKRPPHSKLGRVLASSTGFSLYEFDNDPKNKSTCSGRCTKTWKPFLASGKVLAIARSGVKGSKLGTIKRSDGGRQVTYYGRPLYTYAGDKKASQYRGEAKYAYGNYWYLVGTNGSDIVPVCASTCGTY
jgi:predicted lipoprotein with Yx(FWY)xxD motif